MPSKRHKPEEIVAKLRQVDVLTSQGQSVADAIRSIGVTEVTYYRWRQEFGGLKSDQVKRLKDLETENSRLRRAVSDLTLDKLILQEAARGNYFSIRGSWVNSLSYVHPLRFVGAPRSSCFSPRSTNASPHDGIRRSRQSHLSRAIGVQPSL
jgi:putative transposase